MDFFELGQVAKPQGVKGELKLHLYTDNGEWFNPGCVIYLDKGRERLEKRIIRSRVAGGFAYVTLDGIADRDACEALRGARVLGERTGVEQLDEGEFFICDLMGMTVADDSGQVLGVLKDVLQYGAADVYVVEGEKSFSFPALKRVIRGVDTASRVMTLDGRALSEVCVYDH